jgi:integrase/recombinase XerD
VRLARQRRRGLGKGVTKPQPALEWSDPHCLLAQVEPHLAWLDARGYAASTLHVRRAYLADLCAWCEERGVLRPPDLTRVVIDLYQKRIAHTAKKDGAPLSLHTQTQKLSAVAAFCKWLARERLVLFNPAAELELPRRSVRLPRTVLTAEEAEKVLAVPDVGAPLGLRDRAILETFYSTGIRRSELAALLVADLDARRGVVIIRQGKGRKDRFVPIGERALAWVGKYLEETRPLLARADDDGFLFLGADGDGISRNHLGEMVSRAITRADVGKAGACHLFRHTAATLMLEGGADIRFIQQMLGHASLDTTQIYTQVSIHQLKAVHEATHPGARLRRRDATDETAPPPGWDERRIRDVANHYEQQTDDEAVAEDELPS